MKLRYQVINSNQHIVIEPSVLAHLSSFRQLDSSKKEAGGQLFGRVVGESLAIQKATGPREQDFRSRFRFAPNRKLERIEIREMYAQDLHFVGDWHTHPQLIAEPSWTDIRSMKSLFIKSKHKLGGMVLIIAGQENAPSGLYVGLCNGEGCVKLDLF